MSDFVAAPIRWKKSDELNSSPLEALLNPLERSELSGTKQVNDSNITTLKSFLGRLSREINILELKQKYSTINHQSILQEYQSNHDLLKACAEMEIHQSAGDQQFFKEVDDVCSFIHELFARLEGDLRYAQTHFKNFLSIAADLDRDKENWIDESNTELLALGMCFKTVSKLVQECSDIKSNIDTAREEIILGLNNEIHSIETESIMKVKTNFAYAIFSCLQEHLLDLKTRMKQNQLSIEQCDFDSKRLTDELTQALPRNELEFQARLDSERSELLKIQLAIEHEREQAESITSEINELDQKIAASQCELDSLDGSIQLLIQEKEKLEALPTPDSSNEIATLRESMKLDQLRSETTQLRNFCSKQLRSSEYKLQRRVKSLEKKWRIELLKKDKIAKKLENFQAESILKAQSESPNIKFSQYSELEKIEHQLEKEIKAVQNELELARKN